MVIRGGQRRRLPWRAGSLLVELVVAMSVISLAMLPVAFSVVREQKLARAYYYQAVAMEIVDGEMEALRAGEWRAFAPGSHSYPARGESAKSLPPGQFLLTLGNGRMRLEWVPDRRDRGGKVIREAALP